MKATSGSSLQGLKEDLSFREALAFSMIQTINSKQQLKCLAGLCDLLAAVRNAFYLNILVKKKWETSAGDQIRSRGGTRQSAEGVCC